MKPFRTAVHSGCYFHAMVDDEGEVTISIADPVKCTARSIMRLEPKDAKRFRKWLKKAGF